jgi:hypothetical protein
MQYRMRGEGGGSNDDMVSVWRAVVEAISELRTSINTIFGVSATTGLFTMTATATLNVLNPNPVAGSIIQLQAVNASAAVLQGGANALYVDRANTVAGTSFRVATAGGGAAAGTEQYSYIIFNPLS